MRGSEGQVALPMETNPAIGYASILKLALAAKDQPDKAPQQGIAGLTLEDGVQGKLQPNGDKAGGTLHHPQSIPTLTIPTANSPRLPNELQLPSSLSTPRAPYDKILDPNAREFTPSPSPTVAFPVSPHYPVYDPLSGQLLYRSEVPPFLYDFASSPLGLYSQGPFSPGPSSPPWDALAPIPVPLPPPGTSHQPVLGRMYSFPPGGPMNGAFPVPGAYVPAREHVSRALLVSGLVPGSDEDDLAKDFEKWGPVRALGTERKHEGLVTVHFYDLRHAKEALKEIQQAHVACQHRMQQMLSPRAPSAENTESRSSEAKGERGLIGGKAAWAQYTVPVGSAAGADPQNQGTLVVFNLDPEMPMEELRKAFEVHGDVKELRETPAKRQHRFIEFFDVRDAAQALKSLDGKEVGSKRVKIEFSRPGGQARRARYQAHLGIDPPASPQGAIFPPLLPWGTESGPPSPNHYVWTNFGAFPTPIGPMGPPGGPPHGFPPPVLLQPPGDNVRFKRSLSGPARARAAPLKKNPKGCRSEGDADGESLKEEEKKGELKANGSKTSPRDMMQSQYVFDEFEAEAEARDSHRTTLMIKNIPNKYSQPMLLALLDAHCLRCNSEPGPDSKEPPSAYDFVYLPIDFKNRCNLGYAFVNFTTVQATRKLYKAFHAQQWEAFNSRKICQVTYARVQGRQALEEHFRNSRFACDTDEYLPLVFNPPRDGVTLSPPVIAAGSQAGRVANCAALAATISGPVLPGPPGLQQIAGPTSVGLGFGKHPERAMIRA